MIRAICAICGSTVVEGTDSSAVVASSAFDGTSRTPFPTIVDSVFVVSSAVVVSSAFDGSMWSSTPTDSSMSVDVFAISSVFDGTSGTPFPTVVSMSTESSLFCRRARRPPLRYKRTRYILLYYHLCMNMLLFCRTYRNQICSGIIY